jgi:hypothetical protein
MTYEVRFYQLFMQGEQKGKSVQNKAMFKTRNQAERFNMWCEEQKDFKKPFIVLNNRIVLIGEPVKLNKWKEEKHGTKRSNSKYSFYIPEKSFKR